MREAGGGKWKVALCLWFFHLPPAPFHLARPPGVGTTRFVGNWWRSKKIKTDVAEESLIRLTRRREAKERRVRGLRVLLGIGGGLYVLNFLLFVITPGFFGLI